MVATKVSRASFFEENGARNFGSQFSLPRRVPNFGTTHRIESTSRQFTFTRAAPSSSGIIMRMIKLLRRRHRGFVVTRTSDQRGLQTSETSNSYEPFLSRSKAGNCRESSDKD